MPPGVTVAKNRSYGGLLSTIDGKRKFRLLACACCRHVWRLLSVERGQRWVVWAERLADGIVPGIGLGDGESQLQGGVAGSHAIRCVQALARIAAESSLAALA